MRRRVSDENGGTPAGIHLFDSSDVFHETHLWLFAAAQPGVRKLICRRWTQGVGRGGYLTIGDMQAVLGAAFALR